MSSEPTTDRSWRRLLTRAVHRTERGLDYLKNRIGERLGGDDPITIIPYLGYGTQERLYLKGRVIEDAGITPPSPEDSVWRNLLNTYRRFESDEIPGARLRATLAGQLCEVVADEEGYFDLWIAPEAPLATDRLWHEVALELLEPEREDEPPATAAGQIMVPPPTARFGIISDVDDTVVHTNATSLLKMGRIVFAGNARTRLPFEGVSAFYRALQEGATGNDLNPLFYVSSSPWNLYDLLADFLEIHEIPVGPLMLRDWGISNEEVLPTRHAPHKIKSIRQILDTFDHLPFILIGDSGQEDPEIYAEIVEAYPERIMAIYIRNVSVRPERPEAIRRLAEDVIATGSTLILADDTLAAATHAAEEGWIRAEALDEVQIEKEIEEQLPPLDDEDDRETPTIVVEGD